MAKKEKGRGRNVYFKEASLWDRLKSAAEAKHWTINQLIEITMSENYAPQERINKK